MSKMFKIDSGSVNNPIKLELKRKKLEKELTWEFGGTDTGYSPGEREVEEAERGEETERRFLPKRKQEGQEEQDDEDEKLFEQ